MKSSQSSRTELLSADSSARSLVEGAYESDRGLQRLADQARVSEEESGALMSEEKFQKTSGR